MSGTVLVKTYKSIPICEREVFRYCGYAEPDLDIKALLNECIAELENRLAYKVCYCELPVEIKNGVCKFGVFDIESADLCKNLQGCKRAILFAATIGLEIDRLIAKYGKISPLKALMLEALGSERAEALCDRFCEDIKKEFNAHLKPRFSAGYGDLPLDTQRTVFSVLDCSRKIGLTLNNSLIMSPSKSVTAFAGLSESGESIKTSKCDLCDKADCEFRGNI